MVTARNGFAVTCHHLTADLDSGDVIDSARLETRPDDDTAVALARGVLLVNLVLVDRVVSRLESA